MATAHITSPPPPPLLTALADCRGPVPASSTPPSPQVPFNLPPPLYRSDPLLWSRINHHLWSTCGLLHHERAVLGAVFQHLPTAPPLISPSSLLPRTLIDRLLGLSVGHLRLLARLFTVALLHARAWGGPRSTSTTPATNASFSLANSLRGSPALEDSDRPTTFAIYEPLFTALEIPPLPDGRSLQLPPATADPPVSTTTASVRCAKQKANCLRRHLDTCPITLKSETVEHAHIIPHSVVALGNKNISSFWMMLGVCLGPSLRDTVFSILGPGNSYATTNSLLLDTSLHKLVDKGTLHLAPVSLSDDTFDAATCSQYDVRFTWWGSAEELGVCLTTVCVNPDDQVRPASASTANKTGVTALQHVRLGPPRNISDGDLFRLFTNDPEKYPLPHPLLLDLHGMLWRMLSTASMAEGTSVKKRRFAESAAAGPDDNDDDANDGDTRRSSRAGSRSGRGTPRAPSKRRKKGDGGDAPDAAPMAPPPPPPPGDAVEQLPYGAPDSFDLKWVDFRLNVLAAERQRWGGYDWHGEECVYSSDYAESSYGSEYSDEGEHVESVC